MPNPSSCTSITAGRGTSVTVEIPELTLADRASA
jgi:hypothetical protein